MTSRLLSLVSRFRDQRVAVLGDLVCDEFVHGEISRISREAPVLILERSRLLCVPGGGANAVANLRALGARPFPVGIVGRDESGRALVATLRKRGIDTSGIAVDPGYETPTKSRIVAGGVHTRRQQIVRVDRGARHGDLSPKLTGRVAGKLRTALAKSAGLLVADYGYGAATPAILRSIASRLRGKIVTVDSRGRVAAYRRIAGATPNQEELELAMGLSRTPTEAAVVAGGRGLLRLTGNASVLVTRGAKGMMLFAKGAPPLTVPPFGSGEVADVTGAGDTVIATYTLALLAGGSVHDAAVLANCAAGLVVMKYGTATVSPKELQAAIRGGGLS